MHRIVLCLLALGISFSASAYDFSHLNDSDLLLVRAKLNLVLDNPEEQADLCAVALDNSQMYGWEGKFLLDFQTFDLMGYYWALENSPRAGQGGEWFYPEHGMQPVHLAHYQVSLNPKHGVNTEGVLKDRFNLFAQRLFESLTTIESTKAQRFISILLGSGREFWIAKIADYVFANPNYHRSFLVGLIPALKLSDKQSLSHLVDMILGRVDAAPILQSFYSHHLLLGIKPSQITTSTGFFKNQAPSCLAILERVKAEFEPQSAGSK